MAGPTSLCPDIPRVTAAEVGSAKAQLEKEEQSLLRMKELFEQQLKVLQVQLRITIYRQPTCYTYVSLSLLQAEAVTIQRLIATHSQPQQQQTGPSQSQSRDSEHQHQTSSGEDTEDQDPYVELNRNRLPELNLDLDPDTTLG